MKWQRFALMAVASSLLLSACATKKFVREQIAAVDGSIQELEEITQANKVQIKEVDTRAQDGIQDALGKVEVADSKAEQAGEKAVEADNRAMRVGEDLEGVAVAVANLDQYKPLESRQVQFGFNKWELDEGAQQSLDELGARIGSTEHYIIELRGFTDSIGNPAYNLRLGRERADSVRRYLIEKYDIPLYRIFIEGLGEGMPVADNKTRDGRASNRRVEVTLRVSVGAQQVAQR